MKRVLHSTILLMVISLVIVPFLTKSILAYWPPPKEPLTCGETWQLDEYSTGKNKMKCNCPEKDNYLEIIERNSIGKLWCCGCNNAPPTASPTPSTDAEAIEIPEVGAETLNQFNPLKQFSSKADRLSTPGGIISEVLNFAFPIAGIVLFVIMLLAGFKILAGATNAKSVDEGKQMITSALIGFIILFAAYWIAQLIELIFGISILG